MKWLGTVQTRKLCILFVSAPDFRYLCIRNTKYIPMNLYKTLLLSILAVPAAAQQPEQTLTYRAEAAVTVSNGEYAPLWLTANCYGMTSNESKNAYLRAGIAWNKSLKHNWRITAGLDLAGGKNLTSNFWIQQAYADISWKKLTLSLGSKERSGFPLEKNEQLTSGWMVEGPNTRPVPQIRAEIRDYLDIPGLGHWLALKGHLAYGKFMDGNWQEDFVARGEMFTKDVLYHSKSLMLRLGNKDKLPVEFEFGLLTSAQFGGDRMQKNSDGSISLIRDMPEGLKDFWKIFFPTQESTLKNVEGNHCGSWNFGLNYYYGDWRFRAYLEHYFEDHSQMFWEYGRWKDGHIGVEISFPKNKWISSLVWEGLNTTDQTGPILYDGVAGSFTDLQMSGWDNYYTNMEYLGWQNYGSSLGHPFLMGPQYNTDGINEVKGCRVKAQHVGISGTPSDEWKWRMLVSYSRNWGSYKKPFDKATKQFSSLVEATYSPNRLKGWSVTAAIAIDRGNYPGNSTGGMITLSKTGGFGL